MDDDSRIMREFQRLSVGGLDELHSLSPRGQIPSKPASTASPSTHYSRHLSSPSPDISKPNRSFHDLFQRQDRQISHEDDDDDDDDEDEDEDEEDEDDHKHDRNAVLSKYYTYIYDKQDHEANTNTNRDGAVSVDEIIDDLKRRKQHRLNKHEHKSRHMQSNGVSATSSSCTSPVIEHHHQALYISPSPPLMNTNAQSVPLKYSRFMLAAHTPRLTQTQSNQRHEIEKYKEQLQSKDNEIHALQKQLKEKEEHIKRLEYKLLQRSENEHQQTHTPNIHLSIINDDDEEDEEQQNNLEPPRFGQHRRQKSITQTQTENSTIENVRWELRSEISKMSEAQNEVNRLLQSVGDTSMLHGRLKKIHSTITDHKRKVSALEQTLNVNEFDANGFMEEIPSDLEDEDERKEFDETKMKDLFQNGYHSNEQQKDFEILSTEYTRMKLRIAEHEQEKQALTDTKQELESVNKRCHTLMKMLEELSDEKLRLTLQIEDMQALLHQNNIPFDFNQSHT